MKKSEILAIAAAFAAVYGTSVKQEAAQICAAFILAQKDIKA